MYPAFLEVCPNEHNRAYFQVDKHMTALWNYMEVEVEEEK